VISIKTNRITNIVLVTTKKNNTAKFFSSFQQLFYTQRNLI